jgi:hypothetical protein
MQKVQGSQSASLHRLAGRSWLASAALIVLGLTACGSGPSAACLKAQAAEKQAVELDIAAMNGQVAAVGQPTFAEIMKADDDERAGLRAMQKAGCPAGMTITTVKY